MTAPETCTCRSAKPAFAYEQLSENLQAVVDSIQSVKPDSVKGAYVRRMVLTSTMGPGVRVEGHVLATKKVV